MGQKTNFRDGNGRWRLNKFCLFIVPSDNKPTGLGKLSAFRRSEFGCTHEIGNLFSVAPSMGGGLRGWGGKRARQVAPLLCRDPIGQVRPNVLTDSLKILIQFNICIAQHRHPLRTEICVPFRIIAKCVILIMLCTVELYDKIGRSTVKINNIFSDDILPMDLAGQQPEAIIPELLFLFRHVFAQFLRNRRQSFIAILNHGRKSPLKNTLGRHPTPLPPSHGGGSCAAPPPWRGQKIR